MPSSYEPTTSTQAVDQSRDNRNSSSDTETDIPYPVASSGNPPFEETPFGQFDFVSLNNLPAEQPYGNEAGTRSKYSTATSAQGKKEESDKLIKSEFGDDRRTLQSVPPFNLGRPSRSFASRQSGDDGEGGGNGSVTLRRSKRISAMRSRVNGATSTEKQSGAGQVKKEDEGSEE
jgi:hypothetical protein